MGRISVGAEVEYMVNKRNNLHYAIGRLNELNLEREYYCQMVEYSNMLYRNINSTMTSIKMTLTNIVREAETKAVQIREFLQTRGKRWKIYVSSIPMKVNSRTVIWNGLHIHIGINDVDVRTINGKVVRALSTYWKFINNPDLRFIYSHHLWGYFRPSSYDYKRRSKFKPVLLRPRLNTIEFRLFSFTDIKNLQLREKLAKFLSILIDGIRAGQTGRQIAERLGWDYSEVLNIYDTFKNAHGDINDWYLTSENGETINGSSYRGHQYVCIRSRNRTGYYFRVAKRMTILEI